MAKRSILELYQQDLIPVKSTLAWQIYRDNDFYYKILQEQNFAALNGNMQKNLEYMMNSKHLIEGVNPVQDIYYADDCFLAYRTSIVYGTSLNELNKLWQYDLMRWLPFIQDLCSIFNSASLQNYLFPDAFTEGNILYDLNQEKCTLIDNDGMQIGSRFVGNYDSIAGILLMNSSCSNPILSKYVINFKYGFTKNYTALSFYHWFFDYFFDISLIDYIVNPNGEKLFFEHLKSIHFPMDSYFSSHLSEFFPLTLLVILMPEISFFWLTIFQSRIMLKEEY